MGRSTVRRQVCDAHRPGRRLSRSINMVVTSSGEDSARRSGCRQRGSPPSDRALPRRGRPRSRRIPRYRTGPRITVRDTGLSRFLGPTTDEFADVGTASSMTSTTAPARPVAPRHSVAVDDIPGVPRWPARVQRRGDRKGAAQSLSVPTMIGRAPSAHRTCTPASPTGSPTRSRTPPPVCQPRRGRRRPERETGRTRRRRPPPGNRAALPQHHQPARRRADARIPHR